MCIRDSEYRGDFNFTSEYLDLTFSDGDSYRIGQFNGSDSSTYTVASTFSTKNISSILQTQGGKIKFAELSYLESGSRSGDFTLLNTFELENDTARFEVNRSGSQGINPISTTFKAPIPKEIRRDTPVKFKLRYLDENKTPAQFYDQNRLNQAIEVTSSVIEVNGSPMIIEQEDNLLKGSMYTGNAVGKGFEQSGKSSAYLKTVDYTGFKSASLGIGSGGVMFFSGSVLTSSGDNYDGVGLELFANTEIAIYFNYNPANIAKEVTNGVFPDLSLIHISEPTRLRRI